jgi:hypothetical protein
MLWTAASRRARVGPGTQFSKYLDQLAVDTLKYARMFGHGQLAELIQPAQRLIDPWLASDSHRRHLRRRRDPGVGSLVHAYQLHS